MRIAGDLTGKLKALLGTGGVQTRFARLDGDPLRDSGHYLLAASAQDIPANVTVNRGVIEAGGRRSTMWTTCS